jgi:hypothetical protein
MRGQHAALAIRHAVEDEAGEVPPHLIAGLNRLLHFVLLPAIIIMQREQGIRGFLSGIRNSHELVVVGIGPPLTYRKVDSGGSTAATYLIERSSGVD